MPFPSSAEVTGLLQCSAPSDHSVRDRRSEAHNFPLRGSISRISFVSQAIPWMKRRPPCLDVIEIIKGVFIVFNFLSTVSSVECREEDRRVCPVRTRSPGQGCVTVEVVFVLSSSYEQFSRSSVLSGHVQAQGMRKRFLSH